MKRIEDILGAKWRQTEQDKIMQQIRPRANGDLKNLDPGGMLQNVISWREFGESVVYAWLLLASLAL